ncbi:MAG: addiction module protein [Bacteroidetes bacterium]|nr:addiction module protein [Bacteroidota bacterium]MBS1540278.1 addiction module protein [Bacteroidota bacterium]
MDIQEIKQLNTAEQLALIEEIWVNLDKNQITVPQSQQKEVLDRMEKIKEGKSTFYTWDEVKKSLHP